MDATGAMAADLMRSFEIMTDFERKIDWAQKLNEYLVEAQNNVADDMLVDWGKNDCCTFAAGAVEAMTGVDPMAFARGHYATETGALRLIKRHGHDTFAEILASIFGEPAAPSFGGQGDIGISGMACGVILGRKTLFLGAGGLTLFDTSRLECAFRV